MLSEAVRRTSWRPPPSTIPPDPLETPEADAPAPDPVFRGDQARRPDEADPLTLHP